MVISSVFLTTAWCVESRVPIPDPVHGWLGSMHDSTDRARFCHISTRGDGLGGFVPAPARVARISWTSDPTRGEWGTFAAVEDHLVPGATPCIRIIWDRKEDQRPNVTCHHISNTSLSAIRRTSLRAPKNQTVEVNFQRFCCLSRSGWGKCGNVADEAMLRAMLWRRPYFYDAWQLLTRIEEVLDLTFLKLCVI